jgi:hypothetical protein
MPVPYTVLVVDGVPDFKVIDLEAFRQCLLRRLCGLCGQPMGKTVVFVGGPPCEKNRLFVDPPMHEECVQYAVTVCPYLSDPAHGHSLARPVHEGRAAVVHQPIAASARPGQERPPRLALFHAKGYSTRILADQSVVFEVPQFTRVDWTVIPAREGLRAALRKKNRQRRRGR